MREVTATMLRTAGYEVLQAGSGVIGKPFGAERLVTAVEAALQDPGDA